MLTELGPTFIKLGQVLSLRPELIGPALAEELTSLQTHVPADPAAKVMELIEKELGQPAGVLFANFEQESIASASIGQVHRARPARWQSGRRQGSACRYSSQSSRRSRGIGGPGDVGTTYSRARGLEARRAG